MALVTKTVATTMFIKHNKGDKKETLEQRISPRGEIHSSKRRSESKSYSKSENYRNRSRGKDSKSESESESKGTRTESESKLTDSKTNATAKADEVKAIIRTKNEIRTRLGEWIDQMTEPDLEVSFHLPCTTAFTISIVIFIYLTFTISIFIFNYLLLDHLDHHFQTFTFGNFRVCEKHFVSRKTASLWAKTAVTQLVNPDSTRSFEDPEPRPYLLEIYTGTPWF
jgi:hypothetical protein